MALLNSLSFISCRGLSGADFWTEPGLDDETIKAIGLGSSKIHQWLEGKDPRKVIVVKGKLVNIVI